MNSPSTMLLASPDSDPEETPFHTAEFSRAITTHPHLTHLPTPILKYLVHLAGYDLADRVRFILHSQLSDFDCWEFLSAHDPHDPVPGRCWITEHLPHADTLLETTASNILLDITDDLWGYILDRLEPDTTSGGSR